MSLTHKLQAASSDFQKLQDKLAMTVDARQKLEAQLSENELVKKEFAKLSPENTIYRQIGPALVKQDIAEAKTNVDTRLEFIKGEMFVSFDRMATTLVDLTAPSVRVEKQVQEIQKKQEQRRQELVEIQTAIQQQSAQETGASKTI